MANKMGWNQYGLYNLAAIKDELDEHEWAAVLHPFRYVRMATALQIQQATNLPTPLVKRALRAMLAVEDVPEPQESLMRSVDRQAPDNPDVPVRYVLTKAKRKLAHQVYDPEPMTVYLLGRVGAALLREMGLIPDLRPCKVISPSTLAHSLCILDVILCGQNADLTALLAEKELVNGAGLKLRADVALPERAGKKVMMWHILDIEQAASERIASRLERQVDRWQAFFAGAPAEVPVSSRLLLLFNIRLADRPETLAEWQNALAVVSARRGNLPFELRYQLLADFLEMPEWEPANWVHLPKLLPEAKPIRPWQNPLDALPERADLRSLFKHTLFLHSLSRHDEDPVSQYSVPVASLRALQAWLNTPELAETKTALRTTLSALSVLQSPIKVTTTLNRLVWDVLLRHFGVDRKHIGAQSELQIAVSGPDWSNSQAPGYGDYHVHAEFSGTFLRFLVERKWVTSETGLNNLRRALEWLLGAPYTYAYELGLRDKPWLA